ncbi:hypothetical protein MMC14_004226 [Varicellaria rhodocarpa]|nr:hypothetical protein [Varicellaria rhodocarpa]
MVEQIVVTLTGCVVAFSELEKTLDSLRTNLPIRGVDRIKWAMKEPTISKMLLRLQSFKSSLSLMLTTLICASVDEAHTSVDRLARLIEQMMANDEGLVRRLGNMVHPSPQTANSRSNAVPRNNDEMGYGNEDVDHIKLRPLEEQKEKEKDKSSMMHNILPFTFDKDLQSSRVYVRTRFRHSQLSLATSAIRSIGWSIFSELSLSDISNLSVLSLPISPCEIWNGQYYHVETSLSDSDSSKRFAKGAELAKNVSVGLYAVLTNDLTAEGPDELIVRAGDKLIIIAQSPDSGWLLAKPIDKLGGPGLLPTNYVEMRNATTGRVMIDVPDALQIAGLPDVK